MKTYPYNKKLSMRVCLEKHDQYSSYSASWCCVGGYTLL